MDCRALRGGQYPLACSLTEHRDRQSVGYRTI
jgi:hypothetical protein